MINQKYLWLEILKFNDQGLIPAIAQDFQDHRVLEVIWLDKSSLRKIIDEGIFKPKYKVRSIFYDCDADALLLKVEQNDCNNLKLENLWLL